MNEEIMNYLDDLVVYLALITEHQKHLREVLGRFRSVGFTLNKGKTVLGASEIKYLGHYLSSRRIKSDPRYGEGHKAIKLSSKFQQCEVFSGNG